MLGWLKGGKVDHPLADAKRAQKIIGALSGSDSCKTLEDANHWLGSINETAGFKLSHRFELIGMLDLATHKAQERLIDAYLTLPERHRSQEKRIWQAATAFWKLMGDGYLECARQSSRSANVPVALKPQLPLVAICGMRALRHQIKWILIRYGVVRTEIWGEIGYFATLAESVGTMPQQIDIYPGSHAQTSPAAEFLRTMMFWSALPSGLSPVEQDIAERLIVHLTPQFRFSSAQEEGSEYFFDLDGARPPMRLAPAAPVSAATRYFGVGEARQALRALYLAVNAADYLPVGVYWGPAAERNAVVRVLRHLWLNWAEDMPPRAAGRRKSDAGLSSVHGYQSVLNVVVPRSSEGLTISITLLSDAWVVEDVSDGGCGVIVPEGKGEGLRVGMLVGLRLETDGSWQVGIIRRVKGHGYRQHHIGIQCLSKSAVPVYLRTLPGARQGRKPENAILLNERPSADGRMHLIVRRDMFSGREPIEAMIGNQVSAVTLEPGGVVETGDDFDWLHYELRVAAT